MKYHVFLFLFCLIPLLIYGQKKIHGEVQDTYGQPLLGANVYLLNTYDGTSTDEKGQFEFNTDQNGIRELVVSAIGYETWQNKIDLNLESGNLHILMKEEPQQLEDLVISAGLFEASDEKKSVALRPLDIVTTAGATADIPGVLNTLPGTQTVGEEGRLFIRGGDSEETKNFIDGMLVDQAYSITPVSIPSRMRFSPFLFSGTSFSTGGYSAEYGQALSGTLILKTENTPPQTQTDFSLMSVGGSIAHTQKYENSSLFIESGYFDLTPYFFLVPQKAAWTKAPRNWQNTIMYRKKFKESGFLKIFYTNDFSSMELDQPSWIDINQSIRIKMKNEYHHLNTNYQNKISDKLMVYAGISGTISDTNSNLEIVEDVTHQNTLHAKVYAYQNLGNKVGIKFGTDQYVMYYKKNLSLITENANFRGSYSEWLPALFLESDIYITEKLVGRIGLRAEYADLPQKYSVTPRLSIAYKTGRYSQVSLATGIYRQRPAPEYRVINKDLIDEQAFHYIINYQWIKDLRTFRIELYHKKYNDLVKFVHQYQYDPSNYSNEGSGYAQGIDIFWRDSRLIKNVDYWLSYSFLDTRRLYKDFPEKSTPYFASTHNFSFVYKHFIQLIRSQLGLTYTWASSRPYHNPNSDQFNAERTPSYHDLSMNFSYLIKTNFIIHFSITNLLGRDNIFGYQYSSVPDEDGNFDGIAIRQPAKRFVFLGLFLTLTKDRNINQLRNL